MVIPEGEGAGAEEGARNVQAQGRKPVCTPHVRGVVASVTCRIQGDHSCCYDGILCNRHRNLKLAHGVVSTEVCGSGQAMRDVESQVQCHI